MSVSIKDEFITASGEGILADQVPIQIIKYNPDLHKSELSYSWRSVGEVHLIQHGDPTPFLYFSINEKTGIYDWRSYSTRGDESYAFTSEGICKKM